MPKETIETLFDSLNKANELCKEINKKQKECGEKMRKRNIRTKLNLEIPKS